MTRLTIVCISFIVILMFVGQSYSKIDPKSIVGIWLFEDGTGKTVKDLSQNGHDGEIVGNVKSTKGKFSNALEFPGSNGSCVSVPHDKSLNLVAWTATAWVKMQPGDWQGPVMPRPSISKRALRVPFHV